MSDRGKGLIAAVIFALCMWGIAAIAFNGLFAQ